VRGRGVRYPQERCVVTATTLHFDDAVRLMPSLLSELLAKEDAGYIDTEKTGNGSASRTSVALTRAGRTAFDTYTVTLRGLLGGL
jgi:hypothetical protein